ncbi:hypothetical protein MASR1M42_03690 [Azonexus hydrophilus]
MRMFFLADEGDVAQAAEAYFFLAAAQVETAFTDVDGAFAGAEVLIEERSVRLVEKRMTSPSHRGMNSSVSGSSALRTAAPLARMTSIWVR